MQVPTQVTFRDMAVSDSIEALCLEEARKLERYHDHITSCNVIVSDSGHGTTDGLSVHVDLTMPGTEIVASHEVPVRKGNGRNNEVKAVVHEAFGKAQRQLREHLDRLTTQHRPGSSAVRGPEAL